jgi:hypothetical protein
MKQSFIGRKFHQITILEEAESVFQPSGQRKRCVIGRCDCGVKKKFRLFDIKNGNTVSCGCYKKENAGLHSLRHGGAVGGRHTREYKSWCHMRDRCNNPQNRSFKDYGGRGIEVCKRWIGRNGFSNFLSDMGPKPIGLWLERINNNGNYEPKNCRWATSREQNSNRRDNVMITYKGKTSTVTQMERDLGFKPDFIAARIRKGMSVQEAIETPKREWPGSYKNLCL